MTLRWQGFLFSNAHLRLFMNNLIFWVPLFMLPVLLGLIAVLGYAYYRSKKEISRLLGELHYQEKRFGQTMEAFEEERKRYSGALHEEIGVRLQGLRLHTQRLAERVSVLAPEQGVEISRLSADLERAGRDIRELSDKLLPRILAEQGLDAALSDLTQRVFRHTPIQAHYVETTGKGRYGQQVEIATYRIARELIHNAARHAGARHVEVRLWQSGSSLELTVRDDGRGFDPQRVRLRYGGLDLLHSHVKTIGAKTSISSSPGQGTLVRLEVPIS